MPRHYYYKNKIRRENEKQNFPGQFSFYQSFKNHLDKTGNSLPSKSPKKWYLSNTARNLLVLLLSFCNHYILITPSTFWTTLCCWMRGKSRRFSESWEKTGQVLAWQLSCLLGCPHLITGVPVVQARAALFPVNAQCKADGCHPCGKTACNSGLPTLAFPSPDVSGHWGSEPRERGSLCLPFQYNGGGGRSINSKHEHNMIQELLLWCSNKVSIKDTI